MRPVVMVEAKITIPRGLSIMSGRRAPMTRYFGSIIVFSCGRNIQSPKNTPKVTPMWPKRSITIKSFFVDITIHCFNSKARSLLLRHASAWQVWDESH